MPVFLLSEKLEFPPPDLASEEGLVAVGGDASAERLVLAYAQGIFPWPVRGMPLLWFSPDPRFLLWPRDVHVPRSLRRRIRRTDLEVRTDTAFDRVVTQCASTPRPDQDGTWITAGMRRGYADLHARGFAHSIEAWSGDDLVGGLYGVSLGRAFFGESMFSHAADASKVAFVTLLGNLVEWEFAFVDCQVFTDHLARFGAVEVPRPQFLEELARALEHDTRLGPWSLELTPQTALGRLDAVHAAPA